MLSLVSVLDRCLLNIGVLIYLFGGLRMGLQSMQNLHSTCTTVPYYLLKVKMCGFDESCNSCGCEIVGWVSGKSGCLWFPGKIMSINLSGRT